jgi:hypothetical protein
MLKCVPTPGQKVHAAFADPHKASSGIALLINREASLVEFGGMILPMARIYVQVNPAPYWVRGT